MSTHKQDYIILTQGIIDNTDNTKKCQFNLSNISSGSTRTYTVPNQNTTLVGNNTTDTLTNKNLTGTTNTIEATALKTSDSRVIVNTAASPSPGFVLTAITGSSASWQTPSRIYWNISGTVSQPILQNTRMWFGSGTTSTGSITFVVTLTGLMGGGAIFGSLENAFMFTSCKRQTTNVTEIPFSSINIVDPSTTSVTVNVLTANSGNILVGGTYTGMKANSTPCTVYLYIMGI